MFAEVVLCRRMFLRVRDILRCTANYRIQKETHPESRVAPHLPAFVVMPSLPQAEMLDVSVFSQEPAEDGMPPSLLLLPSFLSFAGSGNGSFGSVQVPWVRLCLLAAPSWSPNTGECVYLY